MKITDDFHLELKPSRAYHKINMFCWEKYVWDTKEGPGKFMKNVLYSGMAKGTSWAEAMSNSKKKSTLYSLTHYQVTGV